MVATTGMDLRIDCTSGELPGQWAHTLYVGPGHTETEYRRMAHVDYRPGATFTRSGVEFTVTRCYLITVVLTTAEVG